MVKGQSKGQKKIINKQSSIYRFLDCYIDINQGHIKEFIDVLYSDMNNTQKRQKRHNLKKDIIAKKLSPTCRAFILYVNGNQMKKIEPPQKIGEIIVDNVPDNVPDNVVDDISEEDEDEDEEDEDEDERDYIKPDMDKWREGQKRIQKKYRQPPEKELTEKELYESTEWITLEKLDMIPIYTHDYIRNGSSYRTIHNSLMNTFNTLKQKELIKAGIKIS